ncbi:MAG: molybdenum ABC transporter ATP-binding protein [Vicinamibacteria bacterium]
MDGRAAAPAAGVRVIELDFSCALAPFTLRVRARLGAPVTAVMGPSGAGKTSLLESIAGVRAGASGRIAVGGVAFLDGARRLPPERRRVGYVPQDAGLFPHLSAGDNVRFGARGPSGRVDAAVEVLGIGPLLRRMPSSLSGGERQRVALARALASDPVLLLMDEPLAGLDASLRERILPYLLRVRAEWNVPILYVTHNPGEALALAGEVLLLAHGAVVGQAAPGDLLGSPAMAPPGEGLENVLEGRVVDVDEAGGTVRVAVGGLVVAAPWSGGRAVGQEVTLAVRAEDVLIATEEPRGLSARNVYAATVTSADRTGPDVLVRCALSPASPPWLVRVTPAAAASLSLSPGRRLWLAVKSHSVRWL